MNAKRWRRNLFNSAATLCITNALATPASAQDESAIDEIIVVARPDANRALQPGRLIDEEALLERAPIIAADAFRGQPSVGVRTNSRGETVIRIRGAEERQVQVFLDGAPLSVPWDGRVDLGVLPAGLIEAVRVTPSAAPIEYGPNAVLGVVDLVSLTPDETGLRWAQAEVGSHGAANAGLAAGVRRDDLMLVGAAAYMTRDGVASSDGEAIPFAPRSGDLRLNTDLESQSLFAAIGVERARGAARLSFLLADAERGVAPEGHLDPASDTPRYWRSPDWRFNQLTLNADLALSEILSLRGTAWGQGFSQTIDQYADASFASIAARESDDDDTFGARLIAGFQQNDWDARVVANAQTNTHRQIDADLASGTVSPEAVFRQDLWSIGAEFDAALSPSLRASLSASYDHASSPLTGGRAPQEDLSDWASALALAWRSSPDWSLSATLGRRTRFPTLRELYGEALGVFIPNPNLEPEIATLGEVTLLWSPHGGAIDGEISLWASHVEGTLARRNIRVGGERFRQRYNQVGARGAGLETRLAWSPSELIQIEWTSNVQNLTADREADGTRPTLYQRPELQAMLALDVQPNAALDLRLEVEHTGEARDEGAEGDPETLPASTQLNARAFYTLAPSRDRQSWTLYAAVENVTDELVLQQLGLPAPGRTFRVGFRLAR
jgi:iron complex outermembrane receptor protein